MESHRLGVWWREVREKAMRKVIEGKVYDTDAADCIASFDDERSDRDYKQFEESLYRTNKGEWFLVGSGGPMSKYSRPVGKMTSGGEGLEPITPNQARQWLEEKGFIDELEEHFKDELEER